MTATLILAPAMVRCPPAWAKFVVHCQQSTGRGQHDPVPDSVFERELAPYHAQVIWDDPQRVEFATDADKTHFVLRWS